MRGRHLVNASGRHIRLLGVNRSGTEFACAAGWGIFDGPVGNKSIAAMAAWHVNTVRLPLNEAAINWPICVWSTVEPSEVQAQRSYSPLTA